jgi:membrane-bound lytic murein transglycosylase F
MDLHQIHPLHHVKAYVTGFLAIFLVVFVLYAQYGDAQLERIYTRNELRVVLRDTPNNYYAHSEEIDGFDYKLAKLYADYLNVELNVMVDPNVKEVLNTLYTDQADLASAGLTAGVERHPPIRYSDIYQIVQERVVYFSDTKKPSSIKDLSKGLTVVPQESSFAASLNHLKEEFPDLKFHIDEDRDTVQLLEAVTEGKIDYTIVDSHELEQYRRFYPELRVGFEFKEQQGLALGFKPMSYYTGIFSILENMKRYGFGVEKLTRLQEGLPLDNSLIKSTNQFINKMRESGELEHWLDVYYGHLIDFDYLDTRMFGERRDQFLPKYKDTFMKAAEDDLDWKLLAAIGYQESHWNKNAVSPTGVRGLMMLTLPTSRSVSVQNREDPIQSIYGGARYFRRMVDLLPDEIPEPDRTWMALASYNIGLGHILDVRQWVAQQGGNPNQWNEVRDMLPKKHQPLWYRKSKHGFARGREAVNYVENIRRYYDLLKWEEVKKD